MIRILFCTGLMIFAASPAVIADSAERIHRFPSDVKWVVAEGAGAVARDEGGNFWKWEAEPPGKGATLETPLGEVSLADFDEVRFSYRATSGPVIATITTNGYPDETRSRNWYDKQPLRLNEWTDFSVDLGLDDDGKPTRIESAPSLRIGFATLVDPADPAVTRRAVEFRDVRLIRHPVKVEYRLWDSREGWEGDTYRVGFPFTLKNRTDRELEVSLENAAVGKPIFTATGPMRWKLAPGEEKRVEAVYTISRADAEVAGPLVVEEIFPRLQVSGYDEAIYFLQSSRRERWMLATPPINPPAYVCELTPERLARVQKRVAEDKHWAAVFKKVVADAEKVLAEPLSLPPARGSYDQRKDEAGGWARQHGVNATRALTLARAYILTGRKDFFEAAAAILEAYGGAYLKWDYYRADTTAFRMRTTDTTLNSGFLLPPFGVAYDYLRPELDESRRKTIEDGFLIPASADLDNHVTAYLNQMPVHQLLPFYVAMALKKWSLAAQYVEGPRGLRAMRDRAFGADGFSLENDMGYHWNSIDWMVPAYRAFRNLGWKSEDLDFAGLYLSPILASDDPAKLGTARYEWAYATFGNPLMAIPLQGSDRSSLSALISGADQIPPAEQTQEMFARLDHAGHIHARRTTPHGRLSASLNYGSPWGREERDLFSARALLDGKPLITDAGRFQYSIDGAGVMCSTIAQSTLLPGGREQKTLGRGELVLAEKEAGYQILQIRTSPKAPIFEQAGDFVRTIVTTDDFLLMVDLYSGETSERIAWTMHAGKGLVIPSEWTNNKPPFEEANWSHSRLTNWRRAPQGAAAWNLDMRGDGKSPRRLSILSHPATEAFAFTIPVGYKMERTMDSLALVTGEKSRSACFVTLIPFAGDAELAWAGPVSESASEAAVTVGINGKIWRVSVYPGRSPSAAVEPPHPSPELSQSRK